jgi:hypothetical protein
MVGTTLTIGVADILTTTTITIIMVITITTIILITVHLTTSLLMQVRVVWAIRATTTIAQVRL